MDLKQSIKDFAREELDMDLVGFTGVARLAGAPPGHRPGDILPGARSVVVMAVRLTWGAVQAIYRACEDGRRDLQSVYAAYGYSLFPNYHLYYAAYRMARFLERRGHVSTAIQSGPGGGGSPLSHRHAAVAAGLAEFGWSNLAVTPDYGPRVRWVTIVTRAALEADPLYAGPALCNPSECRICVSACPVGAISAKRGRSVEIGGAVFDYADLDVVRCRISSEGLTTKSLGLRDLPLPPNPTWQDVDKARDEEGWKARGEVIHPVDRYFCGRCLAYCPIGSAEETGFAAGLSSAVGDGVYCGARATENEMERLDPS